MSIEIDDILAAEQLDVEEIMRRIRAHIAQRRQAEGAEDVSPNMPRFAGRFSQKLYDELAQAHEASDKVVVSLYVTPSRLPVVGPVIAAFRRQLHQLVVFYINQMAARQVAFNVHMVAALRALVEELEHARGA